MPKSQSASWSLTSCFYPDIRREFLEDKLKEEGDFLLRKNETDQIVISVLWENKIRNFTPFLKLRGNRTMYSFGQKEFPSVSDLVEYYYTTGSPLPDPSKSKLLHPVKCPKTLYKEKDVEILDKIGDGNFGEVFKVKIKSEDIVCAVKTLKADVTRAERENFQKELDMMKTMHHENIVRWLGTIEQSRDSKEMKILLELVNQGSLDRLLQKGKITEAGKVKICAQVAKGLSYLHRHHIIHRDVAARNILIHADKKGAITAKVSDFGLSRTDEKGFGYELQRAQVLPIKWLAPECFEHKRWTTASDVWAFGIFMWEVFTDGDTPYSDKPTWRAEDLSKFVVGGGHPYKPECRTDIYNLMLHCWNKDPDKRPDIERICQALEVIYLNSKDHLKFPSRKK